MGLFKSNLKCDCCNRDFPKNEVKDICKECFEEIFKPRVPLNIQVMKSMDKQDLELLQKQQVKPKTYNEEEYLDLTINSK